ncbi:hypothetical protein [Reichenbachiella sp. 5M10]|uniref:hypothetical protein n=1 Tax=Reichenbachiella sp. 5M10 TaxID=1889772 RepID=UPI0013046631|nr:hypothetical protein [Reichenbachiella sp. 5M10]
MKKDKETQKKDKEQKKSKPTPPTTLQDTSSTENDRGGLPDLDFKKLMGCGG